MALNNLLWLICHKTKPNQTNIISFIFSSASLLLTVDILLHVINYQSVCFFHILFIFIHWEFSTSVLADDLSLEIE